MPGGREVQWNFLGGKTLGQVYVELIKVYGSFIGFWRMLGTASLFRFFVCAK